MPKGKPIAAALFAQADVETTSAVENKTVHSDRVFVVHGFQATSQAWFGLR
jgi:hypothetical protein